MTINIIGNSDIDDIVMKCIDEIWDKYDADESGYLDKEECFNFISQTFIKGNLIEDDATTPDEEE